MSAPEFIIPPGYSPPFAIVTDTDHTAWLLIAAALGLCLILLFGLIRVFIRCAVSPGVGLDDTFLAAASVLGIVQSSLLLSACSHGLGKAFRLISPDLRPNVQQLYYSSNILFVLGLGFSKLSVVFFILRLTPARHHKRVFYVVAGLVGAWLVGAVFAIALQCDLSQPWKLVGETCPGSFLRWQLISAFDILIEIGLVAMAVYLVWDLQTSLATKATVVGSFCLRLPLIIAIAFRLATFDEAGYTTNPTLLEDLFIVWTQTELNYSIVSATIPTLRPVMNNLNTHFGGLSENETGYGYGYGFSHGSQSHQMSNLRSVDKKSTVQDRTVDEPRTIHEQDNTYSWVPSTGGAVSNGHKPRQMNGDGVSVDSNDSRQMIIRKDTTFQVQYENN